MEKESNTLPEARSNRRTWIIIAVIGLCAALGSCVILIVAGVFFLRPFQRNQPDVLEPQAIPPVQTVPVVPQVQESPVIPTVKTIPTVSTVPTETSSGEAPTVLDYEAEPFYNPVKLQRGFLPDPFYFYADAGGDLDTSGFGLDCGFTTSAPTFKFSLSGGASETFLRIFFAAVDRIDPTLVVYTPDGEWLCMDNSSFGSGTNPVIDIEYAPSGDYAVWVGTTQKDTYGMGTLNITGSADNTP